MVFLKRNGVPTAFTAFSDVSQWTHTGGLFSCLLAPPVMQSLSITIQSIELHTVRFHVKHCISTMSARLRLRGLPELLADLLNPLPALKITEGRGV